VLLSRLDVRARQGAPGRASAAIIETSAASSLDLSVSDRDALPRRRGGRKTRSGRARRRGSGQGQGPYDALNLRVGARPTGSLSSGLAVADVACDARGFPGGLDLRLRLGANAVPGHRSGAAFGVRERRSAEEAAVIVVRSRPPRHGPLGYSSTLTDIVEGAEVIPGQSVRLPSADFLLGFARRDESSCSSSTQIACSPSRAAGRRRKLRVKAPRSDRLGRPRWINGHMNAPRAPDDGRASRARRATQGARPRTGFARDLRSRIQPVQGLIEREAGIRLTPRSGPSSSAVSRAGSGISTSPRSTPTTDGSSTGTTTSASECSTASPPTRLISSRASALRVPESTCCPSGNDSLRRMRPRRVRIWSAGARRGRSPTVWR